MRAKLAMLLADDLLRGSAIFMFSSIVTSALASLYQIVLARQLGPIEYGSLTAVISATYLIAVPSGSLDIVVTKLVSGFDHQHQLGLTRTLVQRIFKPMLIVLSFTTVLGIAFSKNIAYFLNLSSSSSVILIWILVDISLCVIVLRSALKGMLRFMSVTLSSILETLLRAIVAIGLVVLVAPSHYLAFLGFTISAFVALVISAFQIRDIFFAKPISLPAEVSIRAVAGGSVVFSIAMAAIMSSDVLLVKHFMSAQYAGLYGGLVTASRLILFGVGPITSALLPVVSRNTATPSSARRDLLLSTAIVVVVGLFIITVFCVWPTQLIQLAFGTSYLSIANLLPIAAFNMLCITLVSTTSNFLIAVNKMKITFLVLLGWILQSLAIISFHANLLSVLLGQIVVFAILWATLFISALHVTRHT